MKKPSIIKSNNVAWRGDEPTEIVKDIYEKKIIKPGDKVLDIGCGFGRNSNWMAKMGNKVTAININDDEIKEAKIKAREAQVDVEYIHSDAVSLPFSDDIFDSALDLGCSHMIPSTEDQERAMREAARVLKTGGYLIYFGFSKDHPSYSKNKEKPQFRSFKDIQSMYGGEFEILSQQETRWKPKPEENANFNEHVGINVIMRKK